MNIQTFEVNSNNNIVVNGIEMMWAPLKEVEKMGSTSDTLLTKFKLFVDYRDTLLANRNTEKRDIDDKRTIIEAFGTRYMSVKDLVDDWGIPLRSFTGLMSTHKNLSYEQLIEKFINNEDKKETLKKETKKKNTDRVLTFDEVVNLSEKGIDSCVKYLYNKNRNFISDQYLEDIKQDVLLELFNYYNEVKGTKYEFRENTRSLRFSYFKMFIINRINISRYFNTCVYIPENRMGMMHKIDKIVEQYTDLTDALNSIFEEYNDIPISSIYECIKTLILIGNSNIIDVFGDKFINYKKIEDEYTHEIIDDAPSVEDLACNKVINKDLYNMLGTLKDKRKAIIILRFGLDINELPDEIKRNLQKKELEEHRARTLEEVGKIFNNHRARIGQLEATALRQLRNPSKCKVFAIRNSHNEPYHVEYSSDYTVNKVFRTNDFDEEYDYNYD